MPQLWTTTNLAQALDAKLRALQVWSDRGVIEPIAGTVTPGTGRAKLFNQREAELAAIVAAFHRSTNAPVGRLAKLAGMLRNYVNDDDVTEADSDDFTRELEAARQGDDAIWLAVYSPDEDPDRFSLMMYAEPLSVISDPVLGAETIHLINLTAAFSKLEAGAVDA